MIGFDWKKKPEFKDLYTSLEKESLVFMKWQEVEIRVTSSISSLTSIRCTTCIIWAIMCVIYKETSLCVYCDILEQVVVGDVKILLPCTINTNGIQDKMVSTKLKRTAFVIGKKALQIGIDFVSDKTVCQPLKESAKSHVSNALNKGISSFVLTDNTQSGSDFGRKTSITLRNEKTKKKLCQKNLNLFTLPPT